MSKLGPISHFLSPVSCDSLVLQGLRCEGEQVCYIWLSLSLSHTGPWKFNMAPHGKELSEDLKKRSVALHKDGVGYKKIAKTLKLSCRIWTLGPIWTFSLRGVLTFVASGLDINGCVLSYFEGTANLHCYTSWTLTTLHCRKVTFLQCCHMKRYNTIFTKMWEVYSLIYTHTHTHAYSYNFVYNIINNNIIILYITFNKMSQIRRKKHLSVVSY